MKKDKLRLRKIQVYGNSRAIKLETADLVDFGWTEGDLLCINDLYKVEEKEDEKRNTNKSN